MDTFEIFEKASGSKVNREKTKGMWLGKFKNRTDEPIDIKWVKHTKSLGVYFGYTDTYSLNWVPCIDKFRHEILNNLNRESTIFGKTAILNYIGYSKLWFKAFNCLLPDTICKRNNGKSVDVQKSLDNLTQGFYGGLILRMMVWILT